MSFYQNDFISSKTFFNISVFKEITEVVVFIAPVRIMKHKHVKPSEHQKKSGYKVE